MRLQRVCIVAEHASLRFGGEAAIPFHIFRELQRKGVDAHLVLHARVSDELAAAFPADADRLHFVRDTGMHRLLYRVSLLLPRRISEATFGLALNLLTQWMQRAVVRRLVVAGTVVHQPIPVSPRFPSLIFAVGAPVVIGPMNGGMDFPAAFRTRESWLVRATVSVGRGVSRVIHHLLPGKRRAAVLLFANARTERALPPSPARRIAMVENGVELSRWAPAVGAAHDVARFLFMGRLVDWKALDIVLHALLRVPGASLDVVGDGPMAEEWQTLRDALGLRGRVHFHGWRTQDECAALLLSSTALVLPSLYECGGAVVLEAMATGRPVIATEWGGPADYLDASCGVLVPPESRELMFRGFADAMQMLAKSPEKAAAMGEAGRRRVAEKYDWEMKADRLIEIYTLALG